jgi:hypothetical protein
MRLTTRSSTMKHALVAVAIAALALPAPALGKGPSAATIDGPGTGGGISVGSNGGPPDSGPLGALSTQSGLYLQMFGEDIGKAFISRPTGDLGPKYTVTYTVPGPNNETWKLRQDLYPYAEPAPVTYLAPGQQVYDRQSHGGWYRAVPTFKETLVAAGLPSTAAGAASGSSDFPTALVSVLTAVLLFALATAFVIRRRSRTHPAAA